MKDTGSLSPLSPPEQAVAVMCDDHTDKDVI